MPSKIDRQINLVVDMYGCPNRCKHCWLGNLPNNRMDDNSDEFIVNLFKEYFKDITYYSWLREPDFCANYRERWIKDNKLSTIKPERFELASFYRLVRDKEYVNFLKEVETKKVQLTFFGLKEMTDKYVGRIGAFEELLEASKILKENDIEPRWQIFINEENKKEIIEVIELAKEKDIKEIFVHEGSCDGNNYDLYKIRINKENIDKEIIPYYLEYDNILTEEECCNILKEDNTSYLPDDDILVINITSDYNAYFNYTNPSPKWLIGNILKDDIEEIVRRIVEKDIEAMREAKKITLKELVNTYGDFHSHKVFSIEDYKMYLLNKHLISI